MNKKRKFIINNIKSEFDDDFHKKVGEVVCSFNFMDMLNHNIYSIMKNKTEKETSKEYYSHQSDKKRRDLILREAKIFFKNTEKNLYEKIKKLYAEIERIGRIRNEFAHSYICRNPLGFIAVNPMKYTESDINVFSKDGYSKVISEIEKCVHELLDIFNEIEDKYKQNNE